MPDNDMTLTQKGKIIELVDSILSSLNDVKKAAEEKNPTYEVAAQSLIDLHTAAALVDYAAEILEEAQS